MQARILPRVFNNNKIFPSLLSRSINTLGLSLSCVSSTLSTTHTTQVVRLYSLPSFFTSPDKKSLSANNSNTKSLSFAKEVDLYYASTPNGWKIEIALEELGIPYKLHNIDIGKGDQFQAEYLKISPNSKIPALVDPNTNGEPLSIFESGAILIYLAQKTGKLLPDAKVDPAGNADVLQWLMWQMGGFGPMLGQFNHFFLFAPEKIPYAIERYKKETERLFKVLDTQLASSQFVAKSGFSIADISIYGWAAFYIWLGLVQVPPNVLRWYEDVKNRPAIAKLTETYHQKILAMKQAKNS